MDIIEAIVDGEDPRKLAQFCPVKADEATIANVQGHCTSSS